MKRYAAVIDRCPQTGYYVGFIPGFPGAHSQAESLDEFRHADGRVTPFPSTPVVTSRLRFCARSSRTSA